MRGSVSEVIRAAWRAGAARWMSVFGRSILRIITAWSTFAASAGRCATSYAREPLGHVGRRAGDDQLAAARAQLARRGHERGERVVGDLGRPVRSTISQRTPPASAASIRRATSPAEDSRYRVTCHSRLSLAQSSAALAFAQPADRDLCVHRRDPVVLLVAMAFITIYLFAGQFANFVVTSELDSRLRSLQSVNAAISHELAARLEHGQPAIAESLEGLQRSDRAWASRQICAWKGGTPLAVCNPATPGKTPFALPAFLTIRIRSDRSRPGPVVFAGGHRTRRRRPKAFCRLQ